MAPKQADVISLAHLHASTVSVREQAALVIDRLRRAGTLTFRALTADAADRVTTVAGSWRCWSCSGSGRWSSSS